MKPMRDRIDAFIGILDQEEGRTPDGRAVDEANVRQEGGCALRLGRAGNDTVQLSKNSR